MLWLTDILMTEGKRNEEERRAKERKKERCTMGGQEAPFLHMREETFSLKSLSRLVSYEQSSMGGTWR